MKRGTKWRQGKERPGRYRERKGERQREGSVPCSIGRETRSERSCEPFLIFFLFAM